EPFRRVLRRVPHHLPVRAVAPSDRYNLEEICRRGQRPLQWSARIGSTHISIRGGSVNIETQLARELSIPAGQVAKTLALLDEGATVPFIARYRKEQTGSLDEV